MKGVVFTVFLEMVEETFGDDVLDNVLDDAETSTDGAFTAVGTYPFEDMAALVGELSKQVNAPPADLIRAFGQYLFHVLVKSYPNLAEHSSNTFELLKSVHDEIHVEVKKLYPDSELPSFSWESPQETQLILHYTSTRPLAPLAEGLIQGCIEHYGESIDLEVSDVENGGTSARFVLTSKQSVPG